VREHYPNYTRRREQSLDSAPPSAAPATEPEDSEGARERSARVRAALATLPDAQREVIELHWFENSPYEEIAMIVGASVAAVRVRAHRGYERLREILPEVE
jgi:RNA polymerase sigma factor (sigma-70 family)